jgi:hypothetical protein
MHLYEAALGGGHSRASFGTTLPPAQSFFLNTCQGVTISEQMILPALPVGRKTQLVVCGAL